MARGRILSKSLSCSRRFNALADNPNGTAEFTQLLFAMLIPHVDDFGRMTADPQSVKFTVLPGSQRSFDEFAKALRALHDIGLITVYKVNSENYLQINKFDEHQLGLHKRTSSLFPEIPGNSRKSPEIPASRARAEQELKEKGTGTELKGTGTEGASRAPTGRSKRPIFSGTRFVVFDWQLDDLTRILGPAIDDFDIDAWFHTLNSRCEQSRELIPQRDGGRWLQTQLIDEARRRGLAFAADNKISEQSKQNVAAMHGAIARIQGKS